MTAVVVDLEARELVTRSVDPTHRRRKIVTITSAGRKTLSRLDAVLDGIQQ